MRHLKHRTQLGRVKEHRQALMANLCAALLTHGKIKTTLPKAKALRPYAEKIITLAVKASTAEPLRAMHLRRQAVATIRDKDAVTKLFKERVNEFKTRKGGYTRIYKLLQRESDGAEMAIIELIPAADTGYAKKGAAKAVEAAPAPSAEAPAAPQPAAVASATPEATTAAPAEAAPAAPAQPQA
jgi:large subunit ribosomal protein L17